MKKHQDLDVFLIAAGSHFLDKFGRSADEIVKDGFSIDSRIDCLSGSSESTDIVQDMSQTLSEFGKVLSEAKPDMLVVLGDRFETLTAASAALVLGIPIAHINGGEVTEGAFDDSIRHAITKMASLHFVANKDYERRVLQLGEQPERVHNVGHLALDSFMALEPLTKAELEQIVGITLLPQNFLVTIHPETSTTLSPEKLVGSVLGALENFPDASIVFTAPNPDPGHQAISSAIQKFVYSRPNSVLVESLGPRGYLSMMLQSTLVLGNSSSGVLEAPIAGVPSIDVGDRQKGRTTHETILKCPADCQGIQAAISSILGELAGATPLWRIEKRETVSGKIVATILESVGEIASRTKKVIESEE
jgi:UDP-hydrolysing UDP-N-acetyl-D-glucosamine 2-epimerase